MAMGMGALLTKRAVKRDLPSPVDSVGLAEMRLIRRHQTNPGVVMVLVIPVEKRAAEASGGFDAAEPPGKVWMVFQRFEVAL